MATVAIPKNEKWAEVPEEKVIEYIVKDDKGADVRVIKTFREYQVPVKRNKRVDERRKWEKFGDCVGQSGLSNTSSGEEVFLTLSRNMVSDEEKKETIVCRNCKKNHFTSKCPYKDALELTQRQIKTDKDEKEGGGGGKTGDAKYVPPSQRAGYSPMAMTEVPSLIVSNVSENATDRDLRDLFSQFGYVAKVNVPKDNDGRPRGFAYVTYNDIRAAEEAIKNLDGHRYDYLVLQVDFAKRRTNN
ncbi:hypothetical protein SAMD00019534_067310 [Acytostelium subglobosum LB1]|uniref:hypothetical protein n=1 Tax=Acytostelium subglobosum LB1 TaxID=1410327 RepID=UPI000644EAF2|nr:hypothetical protein SAMD00019534_067310 [Acytostelium subglobosum LB1]GAM23556.1 hypothetical protein SAMD00019534_067310 [Acytostelium subglobosum LB1]|eukprot:XP_012753297.1 hypothetical protein SAMD00019534_067310 [Acytostelium subglobosum LB1]